MFRGAHGGTSKYRVSPSSGSLLAQSRRIRRQDEALEAARLSRGTGNLTVASKSQAKTRHDAYHLAPDDEPMRDNFGIN